MGTRLARVNATTNPTAAVKIFWEEFPTAKPTNLDDATALKNGVHIMNRFLEKELQDQSKDAPLGKFIVQNWKNTHDASIILLLKADGDFTISGLPWLAEGEVKVWPKASWRRRRSQRPVLEPSAATSSSCPASRSG